MTANRLATETTGLKVRITEQNMTAMQTLDNVEFFRSKTIVYSSKVEIVCNVTERNVRDLQICNSLNPGTNKTR